MSDLIYPSLVKGLTWTVVKSAAYATMTQAVESGAEVRLPQAQNPMWTFTLIYDYLYDTYSSPNNTKAYAPYTDLQTMLGFFLARQGQLDDFLFTDPSDCLVGPALLPDTTPNPVAELAIVNDGSGHFFSPIQRNMGGFMEDITDLNGGLTIYANGVEQTEITIDHPTGDFTLHGRGLTVPGGSYTGLYIAWGAEPTGPITAEFAFYFRVRFANDTQDFENWAKGLWTIGGSNGQQGSGSIVLRTSRPQAPWSPGGGLILS